MHQIRYNMHMAYENACKLWLSAAQAATSSGLVHAPVRGYILQVDYFGAFLRPGDISPIMSSSCVSRSSGSEGPTRSSLFDAPHTAYGLWQWTNVTRASHITHVCTCVGEHQQSPVTPGR